MFEYHVTDEGVWSKMVPVARATFRLLVFGLLTCSDNWRLDDWLSTAYCTLVV